MIPYLEVAEWQRRGRAKNQAEFINFYRELKRTHKDPSLVVSFYTRHKTQIGIISVLVQTTFQHRPRRGESQETDTRYYLGDAKLVIVLATFECGSERVARIMKQLAADPTEAVEVHQITPKAVEHVRAVEL
jgi:hypothetical protein